LPHVSQINGSIVRFLPPFSGFAAREGRKAKNPQDASKVQVQPETEVLNRSSVELTVGRAPVNVLDKKLQASVKHLRAGKLDSGAERNIGAPMTFLSVLQIKARDRS